MAFYKYIPGNLRNKLFGEREIYGKIPHENDEDWKEWLTFYYKLYSSTQKKGISYVVNNSGYKVLRNVDFSNKSILELGPGDLPHISYWLGKPKKYTLCDIREDFLKKSKEKLANLEIESQLHLMETTKIPVMDNSIDIIIAFYVLEHLAPFDGYLEEIYRILKPGGILVAGIPTEGGLLWGIGRYFSSRHFILKNSKLNPDKIICWEHPNFASSILEQISQKMVFKRKKFWPLNISVIDFNLIIYFIAQKPN